MTEDNTRSFWDAELWAKRWEALGGRLQVNLVPGTRTVCGVRWVTPFPAMCFVSGAPAAAVMLPGVRSVLAMWSAEPFEELICQAIPLEAYRSLIGFMQRRMDEGYPVMEDEGSARGMRAVNDWQ